MYTGRRRTCDTCSECSPITSRHSWIWCMTCSAHTGVAATWPFSVFQQFFQGFWLYMIYFTHQCKSRGLKSAECRGYWTICSSSYPLAYRRLIEVALNTSMVMLKVNSLIPIHLTSDRHKGCPKHVKVPSTINCSLKKEWSIETPGWHSAPGCAS